ncbi:hypothetical protein ACN1C3_01630 [Pseudomonas sp. H11T01]|uniref:hypothetical protein n=1 Tax=Pseudomonas sp. H11T01 TaxID=3402749 RepID=UPI003AD357AB
MSASETKTQNLPPEVKVGEDLHLLNEKTHSLTGLYAIAFTNKLTNTVAITRSAPDRVFFKVPRVEPGTYSVSGKYPPGSTVIDPSLGTTKVID